MVFLSLLVICFGLSILLRKSLCHHSMLYYGFAIAVDVVFIAGLFFGMPRDLWVAFVYLIQKCLLALALFVVVMFIGTIPKKWMTYGWLMPVRGPLAIIAWFLALGHMGVYLVAYVPALMAGIGIRANVLISFVVALIIFVLLTVLGITSFNVVKKRMTVTGWKSVQRLAYPFFLLTYAHLIIMLAPSAVGGAGRAQASIAIYTVVFVGYALLRGAKYLVDRKSCKHESDSLEADPASEFLSFSR